MNYRGFIRNPLFANSVSIMGNQLMLVVVGMAFWLIAARQYSAADVGAGSATVSAMILLSYLGLLGIDYAIMRFLPTSGENGRAIINTSLTLSCLVSAGLAVIFIAGIKAWSPSLVFLQQDPVMFSAFVVGTGLWTGYWINARVHIGRRKAHLALAQGVIFNVLRLGLIVALSVVLDHFGIFLAWGAAGAVAFIAGLALFTPRVEPGFRFRPTIQWRLVGPMVRYALANYAVSMLWFGAISIMPLLVVNVLGEEANAYFFIAWQLTGIVFAVPVAVGLALTVEGSHEEGGLQRSARRSLLLTGLVVVPAVLVIVVFARGLMGVFGDQYADNAATMLRYGAIAGLPVAFTQLYFGVKRVQLQMRSTIVVSLVTTVVSLALSYLLIVRMGITGAGVAWLAVHGAAAVVVAVIWFREDGISGTFRRRGRSDL